MKTSKRFLSSKACEYGSIAWEAGVEKTYSVRDDSDNFEISANIHLTDCYKVINLDFYTCNFDEVANRIEKIDTLIEELNKFKDAYIQAVNEMNDKWKDKK